VIVFSPSSTNLVALQRVAAAGGVPADVTKNKGDFRFPSFLPDGRHFIYVVRRGTSETDGIHLGSLEGTDRRLLADVSSAVFVPSDAGTRGHLLFVRENTLMAQPFDAASEQNSGDVFPAAEGVGISSSQAYAPVTVSSNGVMLYMTGGANAGTNQIVWFDRAGKLLGPVGAPGAVLTPAISPDEKMIAYSRGSSTGTDIWLWNLARGAEIRLTANPLGNFAPFWSPKGDRIAFGSQRGGGPNLYQIRTGGSGKDESLLSNPNAKLPDQWSRDGQFIVYSEVDPKTKNDVWVLPMGQDGTPSGKPTLFLRTEFDDLHGQLSPDNRWMAYASEESGGREVYVRPFPLAEGKWRISTTGGDQPRWRGDGKELYFAGADGKMMAVAVKAVPGPKPSFEPGTPMALFESHILATPGTSGVFQYDVTADGKRFLVNTTGGAGAAAAPPLTVWVSWTAGLKR